MGKIKSLLLGAALLAASAAAASASTYSFTASNGSGLSAAVTFTLSGSTLTVTLTNTTSGQVTSNPQGLTAVYWDSATAIGGAFSNITLGAGAVILNGDSSADGNGTGTGWFGYSNDTTTASGQQYAASSAGLNITYTSPLIALDGTMDPPTKTSPESPDGPNGSLVGSGGSTLTASIESSVVYTISGVNSSFAALTTDAALQADLANISFQYGTSPTDSSFPNTPPPPPIPLPAALWSGLALLGTLGAARRFRQARQ